MPWNCKTLDRIDYWSYERKKKNLRINIYFINTFISFAVHSSIPKYTKTYFRSYFNQYIKDYRPVNSEGYLKLYSFPPTFKLHRRNKNRCSKKKGNCFFFVYFYFLWIIILNVTIVVAACIFAILCNEHSTKEVIW